MKRTVFVAILVLCTIPATAVAQESHPRSGFWFNGGLGLSSVGCDGCDGRLNGTNVVLGIGGTLSQQWLLGFTTHTWARSENGTSFSATAGTVTARFYTSRDGGFFLLGGLGGASAEVDGIESGGASAVLGVGIDVRIGDNVSLTPYVNSIGFALEDGSQLNASEIGASITVH